MNIKWSFSDIKHGLKVIRKGTPNTVWIIGYQVGVGIGSYCMIAELDGQVSKPLTSEELLEWLNGGMIPLAFKDILS